MDPSVVSFCLEGARRFLVERHFGESPAPLPDGRLLSCEKSRSSFFVSFVFVYFQSNLLLSLCSFVLIKRDKSRQSPFLRGYTFCRLVRFILFVRYKSSFVRSHVGHISCRQIHVYGKHRVDKRQRPCAASKKVAALCTNPPSDGVLCGLRSGRTRFSHKSTAPSGMPRWISVF